MAYYLKAQRLDFSTGDDDSIVVLNRKEAEGYGILPNDRVLLRWGKKKADQQVVEVQFSATRVEAGSVGIFSDIWQQAKIKNKEVVEVSPISRPVSIQAIQKKLTGHSLSYEEIYSIINDIVTNRLSDVEMTYYAASGFVHPYSLKEMYYLTKAMAETGEQMDMKIEVVDKHSIGGIPNNRTTMLVIPIIASLGLYIPKTSSRAITSPAGTADTMEVLAPVSHSMDDIKEIIRKTKACLVWGGGLDLAPADDDVITVSRPMAIESYDKMIVSIMAKKVAMGVDYLIIDLPYGPTAKVKDLKTAKELEKKFIWIGRQFKMKVKVFMTKAVQPIGRGVGPALEARDVLRVLQQHDLRPRDLEKKAIALAGELLELKGFCKKGQGVAVARQQIVSGKAWQKMNQIIIAQGGQADIEADEVTLGALRYEIHAPKSGKISLIDNKAINEVCMNLGAPHEKIAGMHFHIRHGQKVKKGDKLYTLYARTQDRLKLAKKALEYKKVITISKA